MTFNTRKTLLSAAIFLSATSALTTSAAAATQNDVAQCRIAMQAQSPLDMHDYRLRFLREDGLRNRTLVLKAIPKTGGDAFNFTCTMRRHHVVAVNTDMTIKLAAK